MKNRVGFYDGLGPFSINGLSGVVVGQGQGLVVLPEGQEGFNVGVEGLVLVELAVGASLLDVDLGLGYGWIEAAVWPGNLDWQERLLAGGEGQAKAKHQSKDLEVNGSLFRLSVAFSKNTNYEPWAVKPESHLSLFTAIEKESLWRSWWASCSLEN